MDTTPLSFYLQKISFTLWFLCLFTWRYWLQHKSFWWSHIICFSSLKKFIILSSGKKNIKFTVLTIFNYTVQYWRHSHCCANTTNIHLSSSKAETLFLLNSNSHSSLSQLYSTFRFCEFDYSVCLLWLVYLTYSNVFRVYPCFSRCQITWKLYSSFGSITILIIINNLTCKHGMSFQLFSSSLFLITMFSTFI